MRTLASLVSATGLLFAANCLAQGAITGGGGDSTIRPLVAEKTMQAEAPVSSIEKSQTAQHEKSVASGLYMSGVFTYALSGGNATVTLDRVNNDSFTYTTGTLQLSLWALTYKPNRGDSITGYKLATFASLGQLAPRTYFANINRATPSLRPPDGTYWLVLVLSQFAPSSCPSNSDGYCLEDTFTSFTQVSWGAALPSFNYSDLWWSASESGWGISILHHPSNTIFAAWFTYDESGNPKWYVASGCQLVGDYCYGTLYQTQGPPFSQPFNPSAVTVTPVGTISFAFTSYGTALMNYNVGGVTATKSITRQPF
ncbi:MAG TPA: hypothetical protein VFE23_17120 [Usitatibacter sp.]|jgi:hypothetical protein|nr:hypothetical protein [Usitatibacter sp.]